jgi:hypothetical protein
LRCDFGNGGDFGHCFAVRYFWGIRTSVVCQKDALIIAVTSVFFVSFVLSNAGTEFLGDIYNSMVGDWLAKIANLRGYPPPLFFGIIDLGGNSRKIFEE